MYKRISHHEAALALTTQTRPGDGTEERSKVNEIESGTQTQTHMVWYLIVETQQEHRTRQKIHLIEDEEQK